MFGLTRFRLLSIVAAVVAGIAVGVSTYLLSGDRNIGALRGIVDPGIGGPFQLIDQDGHARTDSEFRGKLMIVEFGYTFCPDVCPLGLQLIADVLDRLGPDADAVQAIFITVDPARDTTDVLRSYIDHFSPRILGLTGSEDAVAAAARAYRVYYKLGSDRATNPNYVVDHSAILYVMDRNGRFVSHFTHETPPERVIAAIKPLL